MISKFLKLAKEAYAIADAKKALNPVLLNVARLTTVTDYFLIASAESAPQMNAITDTIFKTFRDEHDMLPIHRDGRESDNWSIIDYGGLVVHVMTPSARKLYALEKIWDDAFKIKTTIKKSRNPKK